MSTLSEAEKRKILRERRQKKFLNGGASSRLNKITGQTDSYLNAESPLDNPTNEPVLEHKRTVTDVSSSTQELENDEELQNENNPEVQLLKKLAAMQNEGSDSTPDLLSLLSSMNNNMSKNGSQMTPNIEVEPPVDPELLNYHNMLVNRLKAWTLLLKWIVLIPYLYYSTRGNKASIIPLPESLSSLADSNKFFMIFTSFEIIATSIYYQRLQVIERNNKVNTLDNNSKILKFVSMVPEGILPINNIKGKVVLLLQYWDVISMFISDVCLVLIVIGVMQQF